MSLFHYSGLNYALAKGSPSDSMNIFWNQLNQKAKTDSMLYYTPTFDFSIYNEFPEYFTWGNNLCNPFLAIQQTMDSFRNGNWMGGMNGFNNWQSPWQMPWQTPWQMPWQNNTTNTSTNSSEYDALRALIEKYKEIGNISPTLKDKINNALNKSGKPEEKLQALKDLYKDLDKGKLEKALLDLPEYKDVLKTAGYKFNGTNKEDDKKLRQDINSLYNDIKDKKADKLKNFIIKDNNPEILRLISYWNDEHPEDESRGIIRLVANNLPEADSDMEGHKESIRNLAMSLINKVEDFKEEGGEFEKLDAAKDAVSDALTDVNKDFTKDKLMELADKFDTLYAMLRMMEAEQIRNTINTKYGFLNDISSTDKDIADDSLVIEDTKADLKNEGISVDDIEIDSVPREEIEDDSDSDDSDKTAKEEIEKLEKDKHLDKTAKEGVYATKTTSEYEPAKLYMVKDDELVEIKGAKSIDKDGNCTMIDGGKKALEDVETENVSKKDVIDYNKTLKRINDLTIDGTLVKCKNVKFDNHTLYRSKGKNKDGNYQYFIVKDNELKKIDCDYILEDGTIVVNGENLELNNLTNEYFVTVSNSDIITTDKQKEAEEAKLKEEERKKAEQENKFKKEFEVHEDDAGFEIGRTIVDSLEWYTTDSEWDFAVDNVLKINKENVYSVIKGYLEDKNIGADNILEQIVSEDGRDSSKKLELINHIIKAVLEYCEKYGSFSEDAYRKLYELKDGLTPDSISNRTYIEKLDNYILRMLNLS